MWHQESLGGHKDMSANALAGQDWLHASSVCGVLIQLAMSSTV